MTMLVHQFHSGSLRRKNKMLAKVLVLALVAVTSCQDHGYRFRAVHHEPDQNYRLQYEHVPARVHSEQESTQEAQYSPAQGSHGQTYSTQSIIHHHTGNSEHHSLHEPHEQYVAPVYQYVQEEEETPEHQSLQPNHYQNIHYTTPAPLHYGKVGLHAAEPQVTTHHVKVPNLEAQSHYTQGHEEQIYKYAAQLHEAHETPIHYDHHKEVNKHDSHDEPIDYYAYPKYNFEYKVEDPHTGDSKFQHEYRDGDVVKGVYTVKETDGSVRIVEYSSDKDKGFTAVVKHTAPGQEVQIKSHSDN